MSCQIPLFSRVIYSVGNEFLKVYCLLRYPAANNVYNLGQSHCIILHETFGGATPTKTPGGILKYGYSIYSFQVNYYAHKIATCVKQNNIIIFLCDLMLHTLINKILNVNIIWSDTQLYYFWFTANMIQATSAWEYVASAKFLRNKSTPYHALNNYLLKACILYGINRKE